MNRVDGVLLPLTRAEVKWLQFFLTMASNDYLRRSTELRFGNNDAAATAYGHLHRAADNLHHKLAALASGTYERGEHAHPH